jgi:predicted alpha/beta superfamily hydrolase
MGHVHIVRDFRNPTDGSTRTLRIYTPDAYDRDRSARFPVLYMHDGQNVFAHPESARFETWCANTALERLAAEGRIEPWIIVGIDHGPDRFGEYSPWDFPRAQVVARGQSYAELLVQHVKPYIDRTYRTRPEGQWTGAMGSSLGGLLSLYLGWKYPDSFGRIGAVSPTVMWSDSKIFEHWRAHSRNWTRIYIDAGADERITVNGIDLDYTTGARDLFIHLRQLGYAEHEVCLVLEPGGRHHEIDWQRRLPFAFRWLLC